MLKTASHSLFCDAIAALSTLKKISEEADANETAIPGNGKYLIRTVFKGINHNASFDNITMCSDHLKQALEQLSYDDKKALAKVLDGLLQASKYAGLSSPTSSISESSILSSPAGLRQTLSDSLPPRPSSKPRIQFDNLPNDAESTSSPKFRIGGDLSTVTGLEDITLATRESGLDGNSSHNSAKILEPIVPKSGSHLSTTDQASDAGESSVGDGKSDASSDEGKDITTPSTSGEDIYSDDKEEENKCDCLCTLM
jgi:hypothetical protein